MAEQLENGWLPFWFAFQEPVPTARWIWAGSKRLEEPFLHNTVEQLMRQPTSHPIRVTSLDSVIATGGRLPAIVPAGVILHISRCGSTLLANALRLATGPVVIGEAQPIASLFLPYASVIWPCSREWWIRSQLSLLQALANIYAQQSGGDGKSLVIKFSSWNILSMSLIRALWPDTPCVVSTRNPVEVMVSNLGPKPSGWMRYKELPMVASELFGWNIIDVKRFGKEEFASRGIERFCLAAIQAFDGRCRVMDYESVSADGICRLAAFFGITESLSVRPEMEAMLGRYSKDPLKPFIADSATKQREATEHIRECARRFAKPAYEALRRRPEI